MLRNYCFQMLLVLSLGANAAFGADGCRRLVKSLGPVILDPGIGCSVSDAKPAASLHDCALRCAIGSAHCALAVFNGRSRLCRTLRLLVDDAESRDAPLLGSEDGDEVWLAEDLWRRVERLRKGSSAPATSATEAPTGTSRWGLLPVVSPGYAQQIGPRSFWVFQQRQTGEVAFNRSWSDYVSGFGNAAEFWVGLDTIHNVTSNRSRNLRIELMTFDGEFYEFEWVGFTVEDSSTNYAMNYASFLSANSSISCDLLSHHKDRQFSTLDRDNDAASYRCTERFGRGGFWWGSCLRFNPNGPYPFEQVSGSSYIAALCIGRYKALQAMRMMLQL